MLLDREPFPKRQSVWLIRPSLATTALMASSRSPPSAVLTAYASQLRSSYYRQYASQLAASGYAVVQYDTPVLKTPSDAVEVCATSLSSLQPSADQP